MVTIYPPQSCAEDIAAGFALQGPRCGPGLRFGWKVGEETNNRAPGQVAIGFHIDEVDGILPTIMLREQYRSLTRLVPVLYVVVVITAMLLAYELHSIAPERITITAVCALLCVVVSRLRYWVRARKRVDDVDVAVIRKDIRSATILGPTLALGFTLVGITAMYSGDVYQKSVMMLAIWITVVACAFCLFAIPRAAALVILSATFPLVAAFLPLGDQLLTALVGLLLLISGLMIHMLRENFRIFSEIIRSRTMIAQKRQLAEEAKLAATEMAYTDYLTQLSNRRHFHVLLGDRVRNPSSANVPFAVGMLDLDGFKPINDVHGHPVGDIVLQQVAARLATMMNGRGFLARMGGDEFAVIGDGLRTAPDAIAFGREIQAVFTEPFVIGSVTAPLTCTCGFSLYPSSGDDPDRLADRADMALYRAKAKQRGGVAVFDARDESVALERAVIEQALRKAVAEGALEPHFQPIVDLATGQLTGFESLARWNDPQLGLLSPAVFVPIAEQIGITEQLTKSLLRKAAAVAAGWPSHLTLSFNLSAVELSKASTGFDLVAILAECRLPPQRFVAEITETAIIKNLLNARSTIENLKAAGIRVALDDFGTGYSSLSQVRDLRLDEIKIDKSFVDHVCVDRRIAGLVSSIIEMCGRLDLMCVAEGIERQDQLDELKRCGCRRGQGYLFSQALPENRLDEYIRSRLPQAA